MQIIGCDFHPRYQQVAALDQATGELVERRLEHEGTAVGEFYRALPRPSRVGIEATGYTQWFERLVMELGHELWVGDAAQIRASVVRRRRRTRGTHSICWSCWLQGGFHGSGCPRPASGMRGNW
jgi:hypothetical protein